MSQQTPKLKIRIKKPSHKRRPSCDRSKRRRLASDDAEFIAAPAAPFRFVPEAEDNFKVTFNSPPATPPPVATVCPPTATSLDYSINALEADANNAYRKTITHEQDDKETKRAYGRHLAAYQIWWDQYQARVTAADPNRTYIPALPITVSKVVLFLDYESKRPKKRKRVDDPITQSTVGLSHIKQVINALEFWRFTNQRAYKHDPDTQRPLRDDEQISAFESAAGHDEPKRVQMAQTLKATGTSSDTYTTAELVRCSMWCLQDHPGAYQTYVGCRDRAMLLLSTSVAFRGDNTRSVLMSDLFSNNVPMNDVSLGTCVKALVIFANNAKHNQAGRTDEFGALRHRLVELCPIGGLAILFFSIFHILGIVTPSFAPNFSEPGYGEWGKRGWYDLHPFFVRNPSVPMSYENHRERVNIMHAKNNINISKVTHAGRPYTAKTSREHGASVSGVKALGGWSDNGVYRNCYDRALPVDALLGAAMFNANRQDSYLVPRSHLDPPPTLLAQVFPWVEDELVGLATRQQDYRFAQDVALRNFLEVLIWFRTVLFQDAAILYTMFPNANIFSHPPFCSATFRDFATMSAARIKEIEEEARLAFKNLPENLVTSLRGAVVTIQLESKKADDENKARLEALQDSVLQISRAINQLGGCRPYRQARFTISTPPSPPPWAPPLEPAFMVPPTHTPQPLSQPPITEIQSSSPCPPTSIDDTITTILSSLTDASGPLAPGASSSAPTMAVSMPPHYTDAQHEVWATLIARFGDAKLQRHTPEWVEHLHTWLPFYQFQPVLKITDIWTEYNVGLNGYISVRDLNMVWGAKWKRNKGTQKTEAGRRGKVVDLVERLVKKHCWDMARALQFLRERYEGRMGCRAFCDYLTAKGGVGLAEVLKAADTFS